MGGKLIRTGRQKQLKDFSKVSWGAGDGDGDGDGGGSPRLIIDKSVVYLLNLTSI